MSQHLALVTYGLRGDLAAFRADAARAAPLIAGTPGLLWKIWALDGSRGEGLGAYLFESGPAAEAFVAASPALAALRSHPAVGAVACRVLPVEAGLSAATGAGAALGLVAA